MGSARRRGRKCLSNHRLSRRVRGRLYYRRRMEMAKIAENTGTSITNCKRNNILYNLPVQQQNMRQNTNNTKETHDYVQEIPLQKTNPNIKIAGTLCDENNIKEEILIEDEIIEFQFEDETRDKKCRICLKEYPEICGIFENDNGIPQKILAISGVQVKEGDGLPTVICTLCYQRLIICYNFRCQVQESNEKLCQILSKSPPYINIEKNLSVSEKTDNNACTLRKQNVDNFDKVLQQNINNVVLDSASTQPICQVYIQDRRNDQNFFIFEDAETNVTTNGEKCPIKSVLNDTIYVNEFRQTDYILQNYKSHLCTGITNQPHKKSALNTDVYYTKKKSSSFSSDGNIQSSRDENIAKRQDQVSRIKIRSDLFPTKDDGKRIIKHGKIVNNDLKARSGINCGDNNIHSVILANLQKKYPECIKSFATKVALQRHIITDTHETASCHSNYIYDKQILNISELKDHVYTESSDRKKEKRHEENVDTSQNEVHEKNVSEIENTDKYDDVDNVMIGRYHSKYARKTYSGCTLLRGNEKLL